MQPQKCPCNKHYAHIMRTHFNKISRNFSTTFYNSACLKQEGSFARCVSCTSLISISWCIKNINDAQGNNSVLNIKQQRKLFISGHIRSYPVLLVRAKCRSQLKPMLTCMYVDLTQIALKLLHNNFN